MGPQFLMDMVTRRLSDPAFRCQVGKVLLPGEAVVQDELECTVCMNDVNDTFFFVACCLEIGYLCSGCIGTIARYRTRRTNRSKSRVSSLLEVLRALNVDRHRHKKVFLRQGQNQVPGQVPKQVHQ